MAAFDHLTSQCDEILILIFFSLDGKSVIRLSQTCRKLYRICTYDQQLWSRMCLMDFAVGLVSPHPFTCFRHLYKCIFQSREILRFYLSDAYQDCSSNRYGVFPSWLWTWVVFNTNPPLLPEWIRNYHEPFLRYKLGEISLGKTLRVWCLKSSDLPEHIVTRVEYGTSYYRWRDIQVAAMRAHGGPRGLESFMLKRCWRARGYVERAFDRIQNGTYTIHNQNKCGGESSEQRDPHSMQITQFFAQIANASRQVANGSGAVLNASRNVGHDPGQMPHGSLSIAHRSVSIAHGSGQIAPSSVQIVHGVAHAFREVAHGSSQLANNSVSLAHVPQQPAHGHGSSAYTSGLTEHESRQPAHEIGESSRESARSAQYVFSSSSNSSIESD